MKKILTLIAAAFALSSLAACGSFNGYHGEQSGPHYWHSVCTTGCTLADGPQFSDWIRGRDPRREAREAAERARIERVTEENRLRDIHEAEARKAHKTLTKASKVKASKVKAPSRAGA